MTTTDDIVAIEQLVARYCRAIDSADGAAWARTFVEDGSFETVGRTPLVGREAIAGMTAGRVPFRSRHFPSNLEIHVEGDQATMRAYLMVVSGGRIAVTGSYEDVLRRVDGEWLFVSRRFTPDPAPEE